MNVNDQLKHMKYRAIDGEAGVTKEACAATCLARLYGRFDLLKRMRSDWSDR